MSRDFPPVRHIVFKALSVRDALYLDTNAWSALAKGLADAKPLADWLARTNSTIAITRFSIGELTKDDRLAEKLADVITLLGAFFVDLGTNDLDGQRWRLVPYELVQSLRPADADAKAALVELLRNGEIRKSMAGIRADATKWQARIERLIRRRSKWIWDQFDEMLRQFIRSTCKACGRAINEKGLTDNNSYVGIKLAFGIAYQRYFLNGQPFRPSDYVDYLHASDMAYFKTVVTERGTCEAIKQVQRRLLGLGPRDVHVLK